MKKICAAVLVLSLSLSTFSGFEAKAAQENETPEVQVLAALSEEDLYENYDNLNEIDVIHTEQTAFEEMELDVVKEVLDNGTDFLVNNAGLEEMENLFETSISINNDEKSELACYVTSEDTGYEVFPVYADLLYDEEETVSDEQYEADAEALYSSITEENSCAWSLAKVRHLSKVVKADEIYKMQKEKSEDNLIGQITEEELAALQTSTLIGSSFCDSSKIVYFYKEGMPTGIGTDYVYSNLVTKAGWSKMGTLNLGLYGLKIRTNDDVTYDNVYSVVTAAGNNEKFVKNFTVNVSVSELSTNTIIDETVSTGNASSTSGKLATSITSSGTIAAGGYTTYAFNPNGQAVSTNFKDKYEKSWTFTPKTFIPNATFRVRPGITLRKSDGKKSAVTGNVSVDSFQVSGGVRTYTIKDTVKTSIKFKNHTEV